MRHREALRIAKERGTAHAQGFTAAPDSGWLSGEWAGESVNELLGDILPAEERDPDGWMADEICAAFEDAADAYIARRSASPRHSH